jgi:hypothetical protein
LATFLLERFPRLRVFGFALISLSSFAHMEADHEARKAFFDHPNPIFLLEDMDLSAIDNNVKMNYPAASYGVSN